MELFFKKLPICKNVPLSALKMKLKMNQKNKQKNIKNIRYLKIAFQVTFFAS